MFANQATMAIVTAGQLEELRALAQEDPLTGLPNRRAFMRDLESELERTRRHGRPLALVLVRRDDLKHINDTQGHPGGDRALCAVGPALRDALRAGDTAFRIGGDEFAVLLPETTAEQAAIVAARVAAGAARREPGPRLSCGIAAAPATATTPRRSSRAPMRRCTRPSAPRPRWRLRWSGRDGRTRSSLARVGRTHDHRAVRDHADRHRARERADRARERDGASAGRLHPRAVAAAEQLGPLGDACSRRPATRR